MMRCILISVLEIHYYDEIHVEMSELHYVEVCP